MAAATRNLFSKPFRFQTDTEGDEEVRQRFNFTQRGQIVGSGNAMRRFLMRRRSPRGRRGLPRTSVSRGRNVHIPIVAQQHSSQRGSEQPGSRFDLMAFGSEVSDESETLVVTQVSRKPRRMVWAGLAGVIAMCAIGVMAMSRFQRRTPLDHVTRMGGLMRAFTKRALQDKSDLTTKAAFTFKEVGADDPSTTGVKMVMQVDADAGDDEPPAPVLKVIFLAKEGKGADLVSHFTDAKDMYLQIMEEEHGEEMSANMKELISIEQVPDKDEALFTFKFPAEMPMEEELEQDMEEGPPPDLTAEVFFGRSIKDMFESRDTVPFPKLPNGLKLSASMKMASAMVSMEEELGGPPVCPESQALVMGLASVGLDAEVLYKAEDDLADKWDFLDSKHAWEGAIAMVQSLPLSVLDKLEGVDESADGIKSVALTGLPDKMKMEATFTNFKIAEVVRALLWAPRPESFWG